MITGKLYYDPKDVHVTNAVTRRNAAVQMQAMHEEAYPDDQEGLGFFDKILKGVGGILGGAIGGGGGKDTKVVVQPAPLQQPVQDSGIGIVLGTVLGQILANVGNKNTSNQQALPAVIGPQPITTGPGGAVYATAGFQPPQGSGLQLNQTTLIVGGVAVLAVVVALATRKR